MFLVYKQVKKRRAEKAQRAAAAQENAYMNGTAGPTPLAMPQPTYPSNDTSYPPSHASTPRKPGAHIVPHYISRTPSPTQSEYDFLNGVKEERTIGQIISEAYFFMCL